MTFAPEPPSPASGTAAVVAALDDPKPDPGRRTTTEAAGIPFSALEWGDPADRPLVLIHGVTASARIWWRIGPALAAGGRRVVAVDLPGHGLTGHWQGHHRFRDNAADVAAWIRASRAGRPHGPGRRAQLGRDDRRRAAMGRCPARNARPARPTGDPARGDRDDGQRSVRAGLRGPRRGHRGRGRGQPRLAPG